MTDDISAADHGFGLFGTDFGYPPGGFCLSTFVVARRQGEVLVGQMAQEEREIWLEQWQPNLRYYEAEAWNRAFQGFRLPATYLRQGEHPEMAAERVWVGQLGFDRLPDLSAPTIVSEAGPSNRAPGYEHWDVLFLYEVDGPELPDEPPRHWARLEYVDLAEQEEELVMLHDELVGRLL